MFSLLAFIICSSPLYVKTAAPHKKNTQGYTKITEGYSFTAPEHKNVKMIGVKHSTDDEHRPERDRLKSQLAILDTFLAGQPKQKTVVLAEEVSSSIAKCIKSDDPYLLRDMRVLASKHGLNYEDVERRWDTIAAGHVLIRCLDNRQINWSLSFGPSQGPLRTPLSVTLDDLFKEEERYISCIKERFSWSDQEQKRSNALHLALLNALQGQDLGTRVYDFCKDRSPVAKKQQQQVYNKMGAMSTYLFDTYTKKMVMDYNSKGHTVLLTAGYEHIWEIKNQLEKEHGWEDYTNHYNGDMLTDYNLKSMLGVANWWDHTKNCLGWSG